MTRADFFDQRRLLDLQRADSSLHQLRYRLRQAAERYETDSLDRTAEELRDGLGTFEAQIGDLGRDIDLADRELGGVARRADGCRDEMISGQADSHEMTRLQKELEHLSRREADLEDRKREALERRGKLEKAVDVVTAKLGELDAEKEKREAGHESAVAGYEREVAETQTERDRLAEVIPTALVDLYEQIRAKQAVAAAELRGRRCMACRIEKTTADMKELLDAPLDAVVRCEECGAILLRIEAAGGPAKPGPESELDEFLN
ncbi:zinc ribbon domain-containing protein [Salininema proteolyticum]|uniref:Zinc ribbon domain-containing protein n=1 Tax=Salininema proteolyticum TaxID=1607685 RepID=A0ABV8U0I1_9ACTN